MVIEAPDKIHFVDMSPSLRETGTPGGASAHWISPATGAGAHSERGLSVASGRSGSVKTCETSFGLLQSIEGMLQRPGQVWTCRGSALAVGRGEDGPPLACRLFSALRALKACDPRRGDHMGFLPSQCYDLSRRATRIKTETDRGCARHSAGEGDCRVWHTAQPGGNEQSASTPLY